MCADHKRFGLFDAGLAIEAMLVMLIDAGVFEQRPVVVQPSGRLEDEFQAAIELDMATDRSPMPFHQSPREDL